MASRRNHTKLCGILAVDKPRGITSHDVVSIVRKTTGEGRVGHCGTLDPLASGLLIVCVGPATRLSRYVMSKPKTYRARIAFGTSTDTDDAEGCVLERAPVPECVSDSEFAREFVSGLVGEHRQVPPAYSAIKVRGQRAYEVARKGGEPVLEDRPFTIFEASLLAISCDSWDIRLRVSKGAYIRALARDIGTRLGSRAHLGALRRIWCGTVGVEGANVPPFADGLRCINPLDALGLPAVEVSDKLARAITNGQRIRLDELRSDASPVLTAPTAQAALTVADRVGEERAPRSDASPAQTVLSASTDAEAMTQEEENSLVFIHVDRLLALYERSGVDADSYLHARVVMAEGLPLEQPLIPGIAKAHLHADTPHTRRGQRQGGCGDHQH